MCNDYTLFMCGVTFTGAQHRQNHVKIEQFGIILQRGHHKVRLG